MSYDVKRTAWVDYDFVSGGGSGYELVIWPLLQLLNVLMWLPHRIRGRSYTLHVYDESGRRLARERYRTRAEAEAALAARRVSDEGPLGETVVSPRGRPARTPDDRRAARRPAPAADDMDGPFRRGSAVEGSSRGGQGER